MAIDASQLSQRAGLAIVNGDREEMKKCLELIDVGLLQLGGDSNLEDARAQLEDALGGHPQATAADAADTGEVRATPAAQAAAEEAGVDLTQVEGSGAEGKVTKADVDAAANQGGDG